MYTHFLINPILCHFYEARIVHLIPHRSRDPVTNYHKYYRLSKIFKVCFGSEPTLYRCKNDILRLKFSPQLILNLVNLHELTVKI